MLLFYILYIFTSINNTREGENTNLVANGCTYGVKLQDIINAVIDLKYEKVKDKRPRETKTDKRQLATKNDKRQLATKNDKRQK